MQRPAHHKSEMPRRDRLAETHDRLVQAVESLTSGEDWQRMLDVARQFHTYSPNNVWLIFAQRPEATRVAGFHTWKKLGRFVRAGEKGLAILAPCVYRARPLEPTEEVEHPELARILRGFRVVHVWDLAQTEGAPLSEVAPVLLEGNAPSVLWERLETQVRAAGFNLLRGDCRPANATTHFLTRTVVVRPDLSPAQATKSLCHELAHVRLHDGREYATGCRGIAEIEAESVAYLVCSSVGVPTDGYSFPYVARWAEGNISTIRATADRVITCARSILNAAGLGREAPGATLDNERLDLST